MLFVTLLLDQSGSMAHSQAEVVSTSNRFVAQLAREPVDQMVAVRTFEDQVVSIRQFQPLGKLKPLELSDYTPNGDTALYDALAESIALTEAVIGTEGRAVVATVTDGQDTCSQESAPSIRRRMDALRETGRWKFVFLSLDGGVSAALRRELGASDQDVIAGDRDMLAAAMKQLTSQVRGYLR